MNPLESNPGATSAETSSTRPKVNWLVFLIVLLTPTLLTIVCVLLGANDGDTAPVVATLGGVFSGLVCGVMFGRRLGRTAGLKVLLGIVLAVVFGIACIGMSCFGCLASGFKLKF